MAINKHNDISSAIAASGAGQLLHLINLDEATNTGWALADVASMFQHQMNAPLDFDLTGVLLQGATTIAAGNELPQAEKMGITNFRQLFLHTTPPVAVLKVAKDFFKHLLGLHPKNSAEYQVAYASYVISVAVARFRHKKKISQLTDANLVKGLDWAVSQAWVEPAIRQILVQARHNFPFADGR